MSDDELATMDDPALLAERQRVREELERTPAASAALTARYAALTDEFIRRARAAWTRVSYGGDSVHTVTADMATLPASAARMVAVEILLSDPDALDDDVLESCLYILREKLRAS